MKLFLLATLLAFAAAGLVTPVVNGFATVNIDLTGFSDDVSVSFSTDLANVYRNQGGQARIYSVPTTNTESSVQVIITEGSAATISRSSTLINNAVWTLTDFRALLRIHLENYNLTRIGNKFNVKLRATTNGQDNVFREYTNDTSVISRLSLSALGEHGSPTFFTVPVLNIAAPVTVFVGEFYQNYSATPQVWVIGHTGNNLTPDTNCADLACDSGRLVARATYGPFCANAFYQIPALNVSLYSTPSPNVSPPQLVRRLINVAPSPLITAYYLAVDNYQQHWSHNQVRRVLALNCAIGECEGSPIVSTLTVYHSTLSGVLNISVDGVPFNSGFTYTTRPGFASTSICVLNLPLTSVTGTFSTGGVVTQNGINCGDVDQTCFTYLYGVLTPNYSCYPTSGVPITVRITDAQGTQVYQRYGIAETSIVVPGLPNLNFTIYDGLSSVSGPLFNVTTAAVQSFSVSDCSAFQDTQSQHQSTSTFGNCSIAFRQDRTLSIFDLAFLPEIEAGFEGNGQLPVTGENSTVSVYLQLPNNGGVFRYIPRQGGLPRLYCVLPIVLEAKITENAACYNSFNVSCVQPALPATGIADCEVCDFLSILQYDLTGLPRETSSIIYVGPITGVDTVIATQDFSSFAISGQPCNRLVNGSAIGYFNYFPQQNIEVWTQGCNGAPGFVNGVGTGNTLKIGGVDSFRSIGHFQVNTTCTSFVVPQFSNAIDISFYAWQHGNSPSPDQQGYVTATGGRSGSTLKAWVNFVRSAWNLNTIRLLDVIEGETVTVCWVQDGPYGFNVDNVKFSTVVYPLFPIRIMQWQGNYFNQIPVLRAGSGQGCPYGQFQRYCIRVFDGVAFKQECTICNDKTCVPENPFVCNLCLNLASPNDTPGLENQISLSISFGNGPVRVIDGQGGTNGCALSKRDVKDAQETFARLEQRLTEARGLTSDVLQRMAFAEVEEARREVLEDVKNEYLKNRKVARTGPYFPPGQVQSVFPVLCLRYRVCVSESCMGPLCFDVDCTRFGDCSYQNIIALASINFGNCPTLPNDLQLTLYDQTANFTSNGNLTTGCQVRGPKGPMLLNQTTCTWSAPRFIGPSYNNVGVQTSGSSIFSFPVLRLPFQVRLDEPTKSYSGSPWPEDLQHPFKVASLDCSAGATCELPVGRLVSQWNVSSLRGLPDNGLFQIKFGENSQNVIRDITQDRLLAPGNNPFCVISDNRPWYVAQWGSWSSRGANQPYDNCAGNGPAVNNCTTQIIVPPYYKK